MGTGGREFGQQHLWDQQQQSQGLQMQKGENMSTAWRGKISVMTCSPLKVLENVMASDSIDRDVAFPKGIHPTEGEMNA